MGDGEGDKGCVSVDLQDEGLDVRQLKSVRKPWLPVPPNHCVCRAQAELMGRSVCSEHVSPYTSASLCWTMLTHVSETPPAPPPDTHLIWTSGGGHVPRT